MTLDVPRTFKIESKVKVTACYNVSFGSVLWHCWFGHLTRKNHPRYDL